MAKVKVVLNKQGVKELLKSEEMKAICLEHANKAVNKLGPGYSAGAYVGQNRVNASVHADTPQAQAENAKNNTIMKAVMGK